MLQKRQLKLHVCGKKQLLKQTPHSQRLARIQDRTGAQFNRTCAYCVRYISGDFSYSHFNFQLILKTYHTSMLFNEKMVAKRRNADGKTVQI